MTSPTIVCALLLGVLIGARSAQAVGGVDFPVRVLSAVEGAELERGGSVRLDAMAAGLRAAAVASTNVILKGPATREVSRPLPGTDAAVYTSLPVSANALLPPWPPAGAVFSFPEVGDSAQAWSTMTGDGYPFVLVSGFGQFEADATAAWAATVEVEDVSHEVVVRFEVPAIAATGNTEANAPASWRARVRGELLVNGHPAWWTEVGTLVHRDDDGAEHRIQSEFGHAVQAGTGPSSESAAEIVYLSLGEIPAGARLDVSLVWRATAMTVDDPQDPLQQDHACRSNDVQYFCSNGTATIRSSGSTAPAFFLK